MRKTLKKLSKLSQAATVLEEKLPEEEPDSKKRQSNLLKNFQELKEKVLVKRPILHEIIRKRGSKKLYDYAKGYIDINLNPPIQKRQDELLTTLHEEISKLLGKEVADSAVIQLEKHFFVSTSDHHGPLSHPFFLNSNLVTAATYSDHSDQSLKNVIVLSCGNVSLNNSTFPRGLLFNAYHKGKILVHRLSFLPSNSHSALVYNFRPYTFAEVEKVKTALRQKVSSGEIRAADADKIDDLLDEIYSKPEVLNAENYSDQVTKTNYYLWKKFFGKFGNTAPNLIYLEQENLVTRLLIKYHLFNHTVINHMLFDNDYEALIKEYFEGIMGTFSTKEGWGTYFFWAIDKHKNYRVSLWKEGNYLVSRDGKFRFELSPEAIKKALEGKEIFPGMMLVFLILSLYYGLKCLGGCNQVNYLTHMKNAYIKMNVDRGNYRSIEVCARAQTKELGEDLSIAFLGGPKNELVLATGLDLILYGTENTWPCLVDQAKKITLEEALNPMMPDFYRVFYHESEREEKLLKITDKDIISLTNLDKKIVPCVKLPAI